EGSTNLPRDESHLVVRAMRATFDRLGVEVGGISLRCVNRIPHGRGLGSSAAGVVAGVLAAGALSERRGGPGLDAQRALVLPDLLLGATEDRLHQDYRGPAMPETVHLIRRLRERGVAAVVSGAGPSVLALTSAGQRPDPGHIENVLLDGWLVSGLALAAQGAQ